MSFKITFKKNIVKNKIKNFVLFSDEKYKVFGLEKSLLSNESNNINKNISNNEIKDKNFLTFNINSNQKVIIVKLKNIMSSNENERLGAEFFLTLKKIN